jgi:polysaccharide export outer membrane protein
MKAITSIKSILMFVACIFAVAANGVAQTASPKLQSARAVTKADANAQKPVPLPAPATTDEAAASVGDPDTPEADAILPYYNNYLKEYRLGPSDMISVEVFGQCPDYCKTGITIPPNARISYPLIREGVLVAGKTVEQVAGEITKKLDEYIIDPKVTVTLDKAMATRYSVMGNVATPGVRVMDRKVSVYEAILEAGGVTKNGDRNKVWVVSYGKDSRLTRKTVSLGDMESGRADMVFLNPGDQVFVAGKGFSIEKIFDVLGKASAARLLFGSPF